MRKNGTGGIQQNLKVGGSTSTTVVSGGNYTFQFNDLMDRAATGPLALYLSCLLLTIAFTLTQSGSTGSAIPRDRLPSLLIDSVDWTQSWMGTVAPKSVWTGAKLPLMEYVAGGFSYAQRQQNPIPSGNGAYPYSMTVRIPALNDRRGRLVKETSNLALLFQPSSLKLTMAPLATLTAFSTGASLSSMTATLTAQLDPRQELVLGTPMEWVLHTPVSGGPQVTIQGFGRDTALTGVRPKGGVATLLDLSTSNGLGGVITTNLLTDFQFQWRGQPVTNDIKGWIQQFLDLLPNDRPQVSGNVSFATLAEINDFGGFPYPQNAAGGSSAGSATVDIDGLLAFILALGGDDLELTDLQTAQDDQTFNLTQTGNFAAGNHQILSQYGRVWEKDKRADWIAQITRGGDNSLASYVLQGAGNVAGALQRAAKTKDGLARRTPNSKHVTTDDQRTYLAYQLA
jgi:hypothetical protein